LPSPFQWIAKRLSFFASSQTNTGTTGSHTSMCKTVAQPQLEQDSIWTGLQRRVYQVGGRISRARTAVASKARRLRLNNVVRLFSRRTTCNPEDWEDDWVDLADAFEASRMTVFVRLVNGKTIAVSTSRGETVEGLRTTIEARPDVETHCNVQRLCLGGSVLHSGQRALEDCGVQHQATLDLIPSLMGGFSCWNCTGSGHERHNCPSGSKKLGMLNTRFYCWNCSGDGHKEAACPSEGGGSRFDSHAQHRCRRAIISYADSSSDDSSSSSSDDSSSEEDERQRRRRRRRNHTGHPGGRLMNPSLPKESSGTCLWIAIIWIPVGAMMCIGCALMGTGCLTGTMSLLAPLALATVVLCLID